jgi:hypothetical protein
MLNKKRLSLITAVAALAAVPAFAATPSYSVKVATPYRNVTTTATYKFKVTGSVKTASQLSLFIGKNNRCASSPKLEAAQAWRQIINKQVANSFTATKTSPVGSATTHYVCSYLTPTHGSTVRAHSSTWYTAVVAGY